MVDPSSSSWFSKMASEYEQEGVDAVLLDSAHPEDVPVCQCSVLVFCCSSVRF